MMKKKINICLILAVLILWGIIGYRIVKNYFYMPKNSNEYAYDYYDNIDIITQRDTFVLKPLQGNPFHTNKRFRTSSKENILVKPQSSINLRTKHFSERLTPQVETLLWPNVEYYGFIKSHKNPEIYLMKVDNKVIRLKRGETKNGITINNVFKDSIILSFQKEKRTFYIKK